MYEIFFCVDHKKDEKSVHRTESKREALEIYLDYLDEINLDYKELDFEVSISVFIMLGSNKVRQWHFLP